MTPTGFEMNTEHQWSRFLNTQWRCLQKQRWSLFHIGICYHMVNRHNTYN